MAAIQERVLVTIDDLEAGTVKRRTRVEILPLDPEDALYVRRVWRDSNHETNAHHRLRWAEYKRLVLPRIDALLARDDVQVLGAYDSERKLRGWIGWSRGDVPALHYVWVRLDTRRQGLALRLVEAAELGPRFVYTFRGEKPRVGPPYDKTMAAAFARRCFDVRHVPIADYLAGSSR